MIANFTKTMILLLTIGGFTSSTAQNIPAKKYNSLSRDGIKGAVYISEISSYTIDTANKIIRQDSCCITRTEFDKNGNNINQERITMAGIYQGGTVTKYHRNGLIKQISFMDKDRRTTAIENYFIDANGNYIGGDAYDDGKLLRTFKITGQNEYGQWTRLTWYSLDGKIYREEEYTYDGNQRVREIWKAYKDDSNGKIVQDLTFNYNARGEMIAQQGIHSQLGQVRQNPNRIYEYDTYGNWIQYIILNPAGKPQRVVKRNLSYR